MAANRLYYGDNLDILRNREYFPNECVDLIYLDPPFNSNRSYNVLFRDQSRLRPSRILCAVTRIKQGYNVAEES